MLPLLISTISDESDRDFMKRLYIEHHHVMRREACRVAGKTAPLDDILQDAFVKLIGKIPLLRTLSCCALATYIVYTVRSTSLNHLKKTGVMQKHAYLGADADALGSISDTAEDDTPGPEAAAIRKDGVEALKAALRKLPDRDRELLEYKYLLDLSDKAIADIFGVKPSSIREYLTRARRKALKMMGGMNDAE